MKKPDRFERAVEKAYNKWMSGDIQEEFCVVAAKLLRREHRAVVRLVKQEMRTQVYRNICNEAVRLTTYERLLAALTKRQR